MTCSLVASTYLAMSLLMKQSFLSLLDPLPLLNLCPLNPCPHLNPTIRSYPCFTSLSCHRLPLPTPPHPHPLPWQTQHLPLHFLPRQHKTPKPLPRQITHLHELLLLLQCMSHPLRQALDLPLSFHLVPSRQLLPLMIILCALEQNQGFVNHVNRLIFTSILLFLPFLLITKLLFSIHIGLLL